jgi:hypothetical protein
MAWINGPVNAAAGFLLSPIGHMPGWLSITIVSALTGVVLLFIFKHTSNQRAIGLTRDGITADMLALRLFKDDITVTFRSQAGLIKGSLKLLFYSIIPLLVMIVPVSILLAQLGLWYQLRPVAPGEEALVTVRLDASAGAPLPVIDIVSVPGAEVVTGPVRVLSKRELHWMIRAGESGYTRITFDVEGSKIDKELVIGDGLMRVSDRRPGWNVFEILMHPLEKPFEPDSPIQSIGVEYPPRKAGISGSGRWLIFFFVASLCFALIFKPVLKVRI